MSKLVVIDDEEDVRDVVQRLLRRAGYEVIGAADGPSGLDAIVANQPDLVICDITMPGMTGYEVLLNLRQNYPGLNEMPFVFMSALSDAQDIVAGRKFGADDYVPKPVNFDLLLITIETRLEKAQAAKVAAGRDVWRPSIGVVPHDFRNPLNGIVGCAEILGLGMAGPLHNAEQSRLVGEIQGSALRLLDLLDDMIDLTNIATGHATGRSDSVVFAPLLKQMGDSVLREVGKPHIRIVTDISDDLPNLVCDERLLSRAFVHILTNAVRLSKPQGDILVRAAREGDGLVIEVLDTGYGMSEDDVLRLSRPFSEIAKGSRSFEGLGIGLPLARAVMDMHGFSFALTSSPAQGTKVTVTVPASRLG